MSAACASTGWVLGVVGVQPAWCDVYAIRAHAGNNPDRAAAVFGRSEFGLPPTDIRF
jgi:hypothetical protein